MESRWENNAFSRACICCEARALCCSAANIFISSSLEVVKLLHAIFVLQAKTYLLILQKGVEISLKRKNHYAFEAIIITVLQFRLQSFAEGRMFNVDLFLLNEVTFKLLLSLVSFLDKWYQDRKCHVWHVLSLFFFF